MRAVRAIGKARWKRDLASVNMSETVGYVDCGTFLTCWLVLDVFSGCLMVLGRHKRSKNRWVCGCCFCSAVLSLVVEEGSGLHMMADDEDDNGEAGTYLVVFLNALFPLERYSHGEHSYVYYTLSFCVHLSPCIRIGSLFLCQPLSLYTNRY